MKNIQSVLLVFIFLFMCVVVSFAQSSFGFKTGITFSSVQAIRLSGNPYPHTNKKSSKIGCGGSIGVLMDIGLRHDFSLLSEVNFLQKNYQLNLEQLQSGWKTKIRRNYIEVPILLKKTFKLKKMQLFISAGPSFGFILNGKIKSNFPLLNDTGETVYETPYEIGEGDGEGRTDISFASGAGLSFPTKNGRWFMEIRTMYSLFDISYDYGNNNQIEKNAVGQLSIGYLMPFRK